ncbi:DUF3108 domain-containing protein [Roseateles sp. BYS180W]|uniref:DUF3108 domain-containing protein n=1 Tax=Roseateles rivi TaxID=3299028 RepID=A0ABW7FSB3_9BURK
MAGRLKRRLLAAALVLAVLAAHALLLQWWQRQQGPWLDGLGAAPQLLEAQFVQELQPAAPAPEAAPAKSTPAVESTTLALQELPAPETETAPPPEAPASAASAATPAAELAKATASPELAPAPEATASAPAESGVNPFEPGPEWPVSTQLDYRLHGYYRGEVFGQAQVRWLRQGRHYQVHLEVQIGPSLAPLVRRRMSSDGQITAQGLSPTRYDEETQLLLGAPRRAAIVFDEHELRLGQGQPQARPEGVQDSVSQFVQLSWIFLSRASQLQGGGAIEFPLALPRKLYAWRYDASPSERMPTALGEMELIHLRPAVTMSGGDLQAEVWLAPTLQYLPVRLRMAQGSGVWIELNLRQLPLQTAIDPPKSRGEMNLGTSGLVETPAMSN